MKHRSLPGHHAMTGRFAQAHKNRIEQRVLEFLRDDRAQDSRKSHRLTHPFEVAVMIATKNYRMARLQLFPPQFHVFQLHVPRDILTREARAPIKIEHCPGEMLVGLAHNPGSAARREFIAERYLEIAQRNATACSVKRGGNCSRELREAITRLARKERDDFRGALESEPLETITNFFPGGAHRASVSTLRLRREWVHVAACYAVIPSGAARDLAIASCASCNLRTHNTGIEAALILACVMTRVIGRSLPVYTAREEALLSNRYESIVALRFRYDHATP